MIHVKECNSLGELEKFEPVWNSLLEKSEDNDIFSTWEWISCWWKHLGKLRELKVLLAEENGNIMAIAPLMLSKYRFMKFGTIRKIEFVGGHQSDYNNLICSMNGDQCLEAFLRHLDRQPDWDCLELTNVREGTLSSKLLSEPHIAPSQKLERSVSTLCPYMELPSSVEEFTKNLKRDMRHLLRRKMRRLSEEYRIDLKTHSDFGSIREAMDLLFDLHQKRWRLKGESGVFGLQEVSDFHRDLANIFSEKAWLALSFLVANEQPIATDYSFDYRGKRYGYQSGFDPRFARYSVGSLLRMRNIEMCIAKGLKEYDFLRGGQRYKLLWPTEIRRNFTIQLVRKGWLTKTRRRIVKSKLLPQGILKKLGQRMFLEQMDKRQSETIS
jgi:CelD/BcsL family acetyltransferase involved in cellulose biosynthesis